MNKAPETPKDPLINDINEYTDKIKKDEKYFTGGKLLDKLIQNCSQNNILEDVWLKVIVVNHLYSTSIIDTFKMAKHICRNLNDVDKKFTSGDLGLVDEIRKGHGINRRGGNEIDFYSFATKYCSKHNKNKYPIFDKYVKQMLLEYKQKDKFAEFTEKELRIYQRFVEIIYEFKKYYKLSCSMREIDWFLWSYGKVFVNMK